MTSHNDRAPDHGIDLEARFAPADDVIAALATIPGINDDLDQRNTAREQMERDQLGLAQIRQAAELTQAEIARKTGIHQTGVSKLEGRDGVLMSTFRAYLDALGAEATITIRVGGTKRTVTLAELVTHDSTAA